MALYRIKQFYWALTAKISKDDVNFTNYILNIKELKLFNKLSVQEQKHSVKVAYDVQNICNNKYERVNTNLLLKAALLHDIGKIYSRLNIIDKSIMVLGDKFSRGRLKKFSNNKKINIYYNHAILGKELLRKIETDDRLLYLVENHHNEKIINDLELDILRYCDRRN
ncbi:HD domain-containing protein [Clostridium sp. JNZ X4-2]